MFRHLKSILGLSSPVQDYQRILKDLQSKNTLDWEIFIHSQAVDGRFDNIQLKYGDADHILVKNQHEFYYFREKQMTFFCSLDQKMQSELKQLIQNILGKAILRMQEKLAPLNVSTPALNIPVEQKNLKWLELTSDFTKNALERLKLDSDLILQASVIIKEKNEAILLRYKIFNIDYLFELDQTGQYVVTVFDHKKGEGEAEMKLDYPFLTLLRPSFNCALKLTESLREVV